MGELVGELRSARSAVMGRFGRVALMLLYQFLARKGGVLPQKVQTGLRERSATLPDLDPRSTQARLAATFLTPRASAILPVMAFWAVAE